MRSRPRATKRLLALLLLTAGLAAASCGSSPRKQSTPVTSRLVPQSPTALGTPTVATARPVGAPVGAAQRVPATGTTLVVTVTKVIDPLHGSGAKVPAGMRPVGVVIHVRNAGPGGYDSSATSDFSLLSTAGRAMPVFAPAGVCQTYVQDFLNALSARQTRPGCIAYLIPSGKAPTRVRFAPEGGTAGHGVSWVVR